MAYRVALVAALATVVGGIVFLLLSTPQAGTAGIDAIRFDTTGWNQIDISLFSKMWKNAAGDVLELKWVPEFAGVGVGDDVASLRDQSRRLASSKGGSLVYADAVAVADRKASALIYKRDQVPAYQYIGMLLVRNDADRFVFSMNSTESGTTGVRDALVAARLVEQGKLDPRLVDSNRKVKGWFVDPYDAALSGATVTSVADAEEYDALTPSHPLSRLRAALRSFQRTIAFPVSR